MSLKLHCHPFASFCQKVLIALYELEVPFTSHLVDLGDPAARDAFARVWPFAKFPVLRDESRGVTIPESTLIIEWLDRHHRRGAPLVPDDPDAALRCRLLDRVFDLYVQEPMQKVVLDASR